MNLLVIWLHYIFLLIEIHQWLLITRVEGPESSSNSVQAFTQSGSKPHASHTHTDTHTHRPTSSLTKLSPLLCTHCAHDSHLSLPFLHFMSGKPLLLLKTEAFSSSLGWSPWSSALPPSRVLVQISWKQILACLVRSCLHLCYGSVAVIQPLGRVQLLVTSWTAAH